MPRGGHDVGLHQPHPLRLVQHAAQVGAPDVGAQEAAQVSGERQIGRRERGSLSSVGPPRRRLAGNEKGAINVKTFGAFDSFILGSQGRCKVTCPFSCEVSLLETQDRGQCIKRGFTQPTPVYLRRIAKAP